MAISASFYLSVRPDESFVMTKKFARLEDAFYRSIRTSNGSWKSTEHNRLDGMNDVFFRSASHRLPPRPVVMDIGVSSGISTLEWLLDFERRAIPVDIIASDRTLVVYLADLGLGFRAMLERSGHILQVEAAKVGFRVWCAKRDYLSGSFVLRRALDLFARARLSRAGLALPISAPSPILAGPHVLICPQLRGRQNVVIEEDDILRPPAPARFRAADVIRLANIMQRTNFTDDQMRRVAENVQARCRGDGAFVVLCRNRGRSLEGSILRASSSGFVVQNRLGPGSEAERYFTRP